MAKKSAAKPKADLTMTVEEAGRRLGISRMHAYQCAKTGEIPTVRLGRRLLVPVERLKAMLSGGIQPVKVRD